MKANKRKRQDNTSPDKSSFPVVGVGASARDIERTHEDIRSVADDQAAYEELRTANDELTVVNQQLMGLNRQITEERDYAEAILFAIREPLLVLDKTLRVKTANKSFFKTFLVNEAETEGKLVFDLGNNQWDIPALRTLLERVLPEKESFSDFEVTHDFQLIGRRTMLLNAREVLTGHESEKFILLAIEDITQQAETDRHRALLSAVVESSDDAIVSKTLEGIIMSWNSGAERMFGYSPEEAIGKHITLIIPRELQHEEDMIIGKIKRGEQILNFHTTRQAKDGTRINISLTVSPVRDKEGKIIGASKIARDITKQQQAAKLVEDREKRFNNLLMQSPFAFGILKGEDMVVFLANDAIKEAWGKGPDVDGKKLLDILPELKGQMFLALLQSVYKTGAPHYAHETLARLVRKGVFEDVYFNFVYQPYREVDGTISGVVIIANEVTPQALVNKKIEESERQFRHLADALPQIVWTADAEGNVNYFNKILLDYPGLSYEDLKDWGWKKIIHPDDWDETKRRWKHSVETGKDLEVEQRILNKDGSYHWHLSRAVPHKDENGKIKMWVGVDSEIHQQKKQKEELEQAVLKRTYELEAANAELQKTNRELESFTYISSHDLQEPLRKIQTFASRIEETEKKNLSEKGQDYFRRMRDAAHRMQTLIKDLLSYSRTVGADKTFIKTDLNKVVEKVLEDLKEVIHEKNAIIETHLNGEVRIIPFQFHQAINNLISNSLKFSIPGNPPHIIIKDEVRRGSELQNKTPELNGRLVPEKKYCHITISDSGIGFEPQFRDKIFEVFQRLFARDQYPGTGIGLSIVKKIVENHDGIITATGKLNEGAIFDIYIPAS